MNKISAIACTTTTGYSIAFVAAIEVVLSNAHHLLVKIRANMFLNFSYLQYLGVQSNYLPNVKVVVAQVRVH